MRDETPDFGWVGDLLPGLLAAPPDAARLPAAADWALVPVLLARHRLVSLVCSRLPPDVMPAEIEATLRRQRAHLARRSLMQIAEAARLTALLEQAGLACLLLKGAPLSVRAYGDPALRDCRDMDLLGAPGDFGAAERLLRAAGLTAVKPRRDDLPALRQRYSHEVVLRTPAGVLVELKSRLHATAALQQVSVEDLLMRRQSVVAAGAALPAMAEEDLLPYLCFHGARHCWFRLRWLADVAALLRTAGTGGAEACFAAMERCGGAVPALEAMALAHDWLGVAIPGHLLARARRTRAVRARRARIERAVRALAAQDDPMRRADFQRNMDLAEYRLRPDPGYRLAVLERQAAVRMRRLFLARGES